MEYNEYNIPLPYIHHTDEEIRQVNREEAFKELILQNATCLTINRQI